MRVRDLPMMLLDDLLDGVANACGEVGVAIFVVAFVVDLQVVFGLLP